MPILATKLYIPRPQPRVVLRPRLIERLNEGLHRKLTLISAPAGFGKTTLLSGWLAGCQRPAAWLSLDEGDNDPTRFLIYLVAALQTIAANVGEGVLGVIQSPQPPPTEAVLTVLLNEINTIPDDFVLVLDDSHVIDAKPVDDALAFLIEHLPPRMHLAIATREDPRLPLARLRARGQLTELRAADLRFTSSEAAEFLTQVMGLDLPAEDIAALETRTEGWIAGLQMVALSMQGHSDTASFIRAFTGSHRFVLDYLVEEVLEQQSASVQTFLLRTSILDRLCGPLCDAVLEDSSGQETLAHLERANLFIVPLDDERRWYRYHHLFADLLRQRLRASSSAKGVDELHVRASEWHEANGQEIEAFQHAASANDVERAERLIEGGGMPLHFRGAVAPVLNWLESLSKSALDARPSLWTTYASVSLVSGRESEVEEKLQAAEAALKDPAPDDEARDLVGRIAAIRATLAASRREVETVISQSRSALENLRPDNVAFRTSTSWKLGYAYHLRGDRAAASRAYDEVISVGEASGNTIFTIMATIGLGSLQEAENQLCLAAETYRRSLRLFGEHPLPAACEAHLGLARIFYQWNDLDAAEQHGLQSVQLARMIDNNDKFVACEVFLARLKLAQRDASGAVAMLAEADRFMHQHGFAHRMPDNAAAKVLTLLRQGDVASAANYLAGTLELPVIQARVHLAQGDTSAALAALEPWREEAEERGWADERLKAMVLQALARHARGEKDEALRLLGDALALAEPGGFIRIFVDEGMPMAQLVSEAATRGIMSDYSGKLLAVFEAEAQKREDKPYLPPAQPLIEPLSQRELEVLQLIAKGLSNREISERLFLALDTVKGHNRRIFGKLEIHRRTEAVARARELGLL